MPVSTRSASGKNTRCLACSESDTPRMVSCGQCVGWWHYECVNVNESITELDRTFVCPRCQRPSPIVPSNLDPLSANSNKRLTSLSGNSSTSSVKARRARLQLEKLEAQKALMEKRLEQARREQQIRHEQEKLMQEAEMEKVRLQMEETILEETFRAREEELLDEEPDERSCTSEQSSISKVRQWQKQQGFSAPVTTITEPTPGAAVTEAKNAAYIGVEGSIIAAEGMSFNQYSDNLAVGGIIDRAGSTLGPSVEVNANSHPNVLSTGIRNGSIAQLKERCLQKTTYNLPVKQHCLLPSENSNLPLKSPNPLHPTLGHNQSDTVHGTISDNVNVKTSDPVYQTSRGRCNVQFPVHSDVSQRFPIPVALPEEGSLPPVVSRFAIPSSGRQLPPLSGIPHASEPLKPHPSRFESIVPNSPQSSNSESVVPGIGEPYESSVEQPRPAPQAFVPNPVEPTHLDPLYSVRQVFNAKPPMIEQQPQARDVQVPVWGPTAQQLAARQVMAKELPVFSGNPEDWPLFISSYNNTTQACGYSQAENLARLQRCLKGHALESVRSRLLLPQAVPHVIATLETLYGRPELLIHTLLQKVRGVPAPKHDRLDTLIGFGMAVQNLCDHLEAGGQEAHLNNPMLLFELMEKLPANLKLDWSLYKQRCGEVNLRAFAQYMSTLVRAATDVTLHYGPRPLQHQQRDARPDKSYRDNNFCGAHSVQNPISPRKAGKEEETRKESSMFIQACFVCKDTKHRVKECTQFAKKGLDERWKTIQQFGLCRNCLGAHGRRPCKVFKRCGVDGCQMRHHELLHFKQDANLDKNEDTATTNHHSGGKTNLFRIIPVTLFGKNSSISVYAFLDDGSERTLVEEEVARDLGVTGEHLPLCLQWTANVKRTESDSQRVALQISGASGTKHVLSDVRTVSRLDLQRQTLHSSKLAEAYPYLQGLPIQHYDRALPRILIGNDNAHVTATLKLREGRPGEPVAAKTRLGWTIYGTTDKSENRARTFHICECRNEDTLDEVVTQFFSIESLGITAAECPESDEVKRAKEILQSTTKRVGQRFETGLLWKFDHIEFPDSYPMAIRRLQCLERRMKSDPMIGESVHRQIQEYQMKGYIHKITEEELQESDPRRVWYLPLGVVLNPKKPSKVRIFCDAAAKVDGISLNSMLLKGPDLLSSLFGVLCGFREKRIALCADVKEMFHQIQIRKEDRHAQRLLWREDPTQAPEVYVMDVATFGATCSPSAAQFVKNLNATEHANEYPDAAYAIHHKHYVDDYLDSADNVEEAIKLAAEVRHVHSLGGFHLRNWLSNSREVLARVGDNGQTTDKNLQLDKASSTERVLGLFWRPETDEFTFSTDVMQHVEQPTKRQALSIVMSPFDPLGFLSFFLVHGKILIQELWRAKTLWDQTIPETLWERWLQWTEYFQRLDQISIPRCYFPHHSVNDIISLQLHVFVDASEEAFACVAYFRAKFRDEIEVALIAGKSKVAPLKALSIPRLELMAAVIGTRLQRSILNEHSLHIDQAVLWSDSKTVLAWIKSDHRCYRQFVACRIGEILSMTRVSQWRWIPSKENVADDATKWGKGPCLSPNSRWFKGPDFLYLPEEQWPADEPETLPTSEELRACLVHREVVVQTQVKWEHFSRWTRLWRAIAYVHRYVQNLRSSVEKTKKRLGPLTQNELASAERTIWRWVQSEEYPDEVASLSERNEQQPGRLMKLEQNSKLRKLSPFMDETGVIRMESRIAAATFASFDTRFPIVLPKKHVVTGLLIGWYHQKYLHGNGETIVNEVRQRFHIPSLRTVVRKEKMKCVWCKIKRSAPAIPRMAPLPAARLKAFERPFSYVGVDYFGPIAVHVNRTTSKRWVALFTCLTIRAVHLEIVHSLSAESCKMAFRRFVARRGAPVEIYSDRGTNFVGSSKELKQEMNTIDQQLAETFTNAHTKWVFNPPTAPHFGGAWERLVRSVKTALAAMYTSRVPKEETLATLVAEAESIVNSRPLTFIPLEEEQQEALTPNHFLLLSSNGVVQTTRTLADTREACRNQWNLCRVMVDAFWRRWVREYLPNLTRRTKWFDDVPSIQPGDLVIIVEDNVRNGWTRGRVTEVVKARDGRIRQAVLKTAAGFIRRPIAKLARLDILESKTDPEVSEQFTGRGDVTVDSAVPLDTPRT